MRRLPTMTQALALLAIPAFALPLGACGDSGSSGRSAAPPVETTLEREQALSDLDEGDAQTLCDELAAHWESAVSEEDMKRMVCYGFMLLFSGGDASVCREAVAECLAEDDEQGASVSIEISQITCDADTLAACDATVEEIITCQEAQVTQVMNALSRLSCSMSMTALVGIGALPSACRGLEERCPDLFDDGSGF